MTSTTGNNDPFGTPAELDLHRTRKLIEEVGPSVGIDIPPHDLVTDSLARFMTVMRSSGSEAMTRDVTHITGETWMQATVVMQACLDRSMAELGLDAEDEQIQVIRTRANTLAGVLLYGGVQANG